jgi:hypothetical protein
VWVSAHPDSGAATADGCDPDRVALSCPATSTIGDPDGRSSSRDDVQRRSIIASVRIEASSHRDARSPRVGPRLEVGLAMHNNGFDLIVRRQRTRTTRDLVFAAAIVVMATLGLGTLNNSARGADFSSVDASSLAR